MADTDKMLAQIVEWGRPKTFDKVDEGGTIVAVASSEFVANRTPHRFYMVKPGDEYVTSYVYLREWVEAGRPHEWTPVERLTVNEIEFEAWLDFGYGGFALFVDGKLEGVGDQVVVCDNCALLDKDYYGAKHYLWPRADR